MNHYSFTLFPLGKGTFCPVVVYQLTYPRRNRVDAIWSVFFSWKKLIILSKYVLRLQNDKITDQSFKHSLKLLDKYSISHFLYDVEAIFGHLGLGPADSGTKEWMEKLAKNCILLVLISDVSIRSVYCLVIKKSCSGVSQGRRKVWKSGNASSN